MENMRSPELYTRRHVPASHHLVFDAHAPLTTCISHGARRCGKNIVLDPTTHRKTCEQYQISFLSTGHPHLDTRGSLSMARPGLNDTSRAS